MAEFAFKADHPTLGHGHGPTPQEFVLHALAACVTAGVATARPLGMPQPRMHTRPTKTY